MGDAFNINPGERPESGSKNQRIPAFEMHRAALIRHMLYFLGILLAGYLVLVGALYAFQRNLLYHPDPTVATPQSFGVPEMTAERLPTSDGFPLLAWWRPPSTPDAPVLLYLHGNAGHLGDRADKVRPYLDAGFGVLLVTYRYNAGTGGAASEKGLLEDGRTALAYLRAQGISDDRIVLYGESLGTGIVSRLATAGRYRAVILEAPYSSIVDVAASIYWYVPVRYLLKDRYDTTAVIRDINAPLLIVHGKQDRVIPVHFAERLFDAAVEPKRLILVDEAHHTNLYDYGMGKMVLDFLSEQAISRQ